MNSKNSKIIGISITSLAIALMFLPTMLLACEDEHDGDEHHHDNNPPAITIIGDNPLNLTVGNAFTDPGATATDSEDGDLTSAIITTGTVDTTVAGSYEITYSVTDSGGLSASATRTVIISDIIVPPSLVDINISASKIICDSESDLPNWGLGGPDVTANTASEFLNSRPNCHLQSGWNFQWADSTASDPGKSFIGEAGGWNTFGSTNEQGVAVTTISISPSASYIWMREVLKDNYLTFTYPGDNDSYSAEMYCRSDVLNYDNYDRVDSPFVSGETYYCVAFNVSTATTTPPVNTPPIITLIGANPFNITVGNTFADPGATATDTEDGDLTSAITSTSTVNSALVGTYSVIYSVTDSGGLSASTTRTVIVNATTTPPVNTPPIITLIGANPFNITVGNTFADPGATATDTEDGDLTSAIVKTGDVNASTTGTYILTYVVKDSGNLYATTTRTVIVNSKPICSDGLDNDGDGKVDANDPGCHTDNDSNNTGSYDPNDNDEADNPPPVVPPPSTDGGSGSGGGGGHRRDISNLLATGGEILGATSCSYLRDYLKIDWRNDPIEVLKLQSFLNVFEKENLSLTGVFNQATFEAVERFQIKYSGDVLKPWGDKVTTGFVYILTKKKINEIYCNTTINLNQTDQSEIQAFRNSPGDGLGATVGGYSGYNTNSSQDLNAEPDTLNGVEIDDSATVVELEDNSTSESIIRNSAVSLFALPQKIFGKLFDSCNCSYTPILLILILTALAIIIIRSFTEPGSPKSTPMVSITGVKEEEESPVIILPGAGEVKDKKETSYVFPDEEIILENPEEETITAIPDLNADDANSGQKKI